MINPIFEQFAPPMNEIIVRKGVMWRVCYHNPGQARYSAELIGWTTKEKDSDEVFIVLAANRSKMTPDQFEAYRRTTWPMAHEEGRNPKNTTLGVQSGVGLSKGGL